MICPECCRWFNKEANTNGHGISCTECDWYMIFYTPATWREPAYEPRRADSPPPSAKIKHAFNSWKTSAEPHNPLHHDDDNFSLPRSPQRIPVPETIPGRERIHTPLAETSSDAREVTAGIHCLICGCICQSPTGLAKHHHSTFCGVKIRELNWVAMNRKQ